MLDKLMAELEYVDGELYWKVTRSPHVIKGNKVGYLRKDGYYGFMFYKKSYLNHRVIFALCNGYFPLFIDHIDGDRSNNVITNLRVATASQNCHNARIASSNRTGVKGVRLVKNGKYEARIGLGNKTVQVGTFDTIAEAEIAIKKMRLALHGNFANDG